MNIRNRFPIFGHKTYINSCSQGALSVDVQQAYAEYLEDWQEKGAPWELWVEKLETARESFAALIRVPSGRGAEEVAVTTSVSAAVSAIANGLDFSGRRNKVVITDFDFPTTAQIWHAQRQRGAQVIRVPAHGNWISPEAIDEAIDEETRLVSIPAVCYRNGARLDVAAVVEAAHRKGALVLLDAYQALGTYPIDVDVLNVDFLVGGALKYLLASAGLAYAYVRSDLIAELNPTVTGWFAQEDIFAMHTDRHEPAPTARRLESGTPPVPNLYAGIAGNRLIQHVGLEKIEAHIQGLTETLKEGIIQRGYTLITPREPERHAALITVRSTDVHRLVACLAQDNIIVSNRDDNLRVSPHIYNDQGDIERLFDALERHEELL